MSNVKTISCVCNPSNQLNDSSHAMKMGILNSDNFIAFSLKSCSFRNNFYNVNGVGVNANNSFYFTLDGVSYTLTIPQGFYSITQLLALLKTEIDILFAASGIVPLPTLDELVYNPITGKVSITVNGNGTATYFDLLGATYPNSINQLIGNLNDVVLNTLVPNSHTMLYLISLGGLDRVNLVSNSLSVKGTANKESADVANGRNLSLVRTITVNAGFGGLVDYQSNDVIGDQQIYDIPQNFGNLNFRLETTSGDPLSIGNSELIVELIAWTSL